MLSPLPMDLATTVVSTLTAAVVASGASILTAILARPKQRADVDKTGAEAQSARIAADTTLSSDAREWVAQAMERMTTAEARADRAERKADAADAKVDKCTAELRRDREHFAVQQRLMRQWAQDLTSQVTSLGGEPAGPPEGLDP